MICGSGSLVTVSARCRGSTSDRGAHDDVAEVERPRLRRHDDDQPERRALVGPGEVHPARDPEGMRPGARRDRRRADLAGRRAASLRGLRFAAQRHVREHPQQAGRQSCTLQLREILLAIAAGERERERAEAARRRRRGLREERGREGQARRARAAGPVPIDTERRERRGVRRHGRAPRRQVARSRRLAARLRVGERRPRAALQPELEIAEGQLRVFRERRRQLARRGVSRHSAA